MREAICPATNRARYVTQPSDFLPGGHSGFEALRQTAKQAARKLVALLIACVVLAACATAQVNTPILQFRDGVTKIATSAPGALALANEAQRRMMLNRYYVEKLGVAGSAAPVNPYAADILNPDALRVRTLALASLKSYADQLAALTSSDATAELDASAAKLGTALQQTNWSDFGIAGDPISPAVLGAGTTAIHAFGQFLIDRKVRSELPQILADGDPHVQGVVAALDSDFGYVAGVVDRNMRQSAQAWDLMLTKVIPMLSPDEARAEIGKFVQGVQDRSDFLVTIAAARDAVKAMGRAHSQLVQAAARKQDHLSLEAMSQLIEEAQRLQDFYNTTRGNFAPKPAK